MKILVNLVPVRAGGGQQVAFNFMQQVMRGIAPTYSFLFLVGKNTYLHHTARDMGLSYIALGYSYPHRLALSLFLIRRIIKVHSIDIIYSFAPCFHTKLVPQVVRTVYSNLYFPEIDFWRGYSQFGRIWKRVIDYFRKRGTFRADGLVFENKGMQVRAVESFRYPEHRTLFVYPSVTMFDKFETDSGLEYVRDIPFPKVLLLTSWHPNKNLAILPDVASYLKQQGVQVRFVISLKVDDKNVSKHLTHRIKVSKVSDYFVFIGPISPSYVHQIVGYCDAILLLSKLECFSSNIAEAWEFNKVLLISDEPWSRAICEDGAMYVDRESYIDIGTKLIELFSDEFLRNKLVAEGAAVYRTFNNPESKVLKQIEFLRKILDEWTFRQA